MDDLATLVRRYLEAYDRARKPMPQSMSGIPFKNDAAVMHDRHISRDKALQRLREAVEQADQ